MEIGIPCGGRELLDDPNGPGNMAPHANGFFFPMYDYDVPPLPVTLDLEPGDGPLIPDDMPEPEEVAFKPMKSNRLG